MIPVSIAKKFRKPCEAFSRSHISHIAAPSGHCVECKAGTFGKLFLKPRLRLLGASIFDRLTQRAFSGTLRSEKATIAGWNTAGGQRVQERASVSTSRSPVRMYLIALATDYDGTLAHHGRVDTETIAALERLKASGRYLLMVTGRELPDL